MNPEGHEFLTKEAVEAAIRNLPADLNWVRPYLADAVITSAVYRDLEDWKTLAQLRDSGQKHHFLLFAGQGAWDAYKAGHDWIYDHAYWAVNRLRQIWQQPLHGAKLPHTVFPFGWPIGQPPEFDDYFPNPLNFVGRPLGDALHALQDSYSPGHTHRKQVKVGERWIIDDILNFPSIPSPFSPIVGIFAAEVRVHMWLDEKWKTDELGKEAIEAGRELIRIVVTSSVMPRDEWVKWKWDSLWGIFAARFLSQNLGSEPGRYPDRSTG